MGICKVVFILIVSVGLLSMVAPCMAGEKYLSGGPNLSAAVLGPNEFSPGTEVNLPIAIQNSGLLDYVFTYPNQITPADLPNTAKLMTVTLGPGDSPLVVKSDPQLVGDLLGGKNLVATFKVEIPSDTSGEFYTLPLTVQYTYLDHADQYGTDALQYFYRTTTKSIDVPVRIRQEVIPEVQSVSGSDLNAGTQGFLDITLKNTGNLNGTEATVMLIQNGKSPVVPVASSVYIGNFPKNAVIPLSYKVSVAKDAEASTYPINLTVSYKNAEGTLLTSNPIIIGVPVAGKINFTVISPPAQFNPGIKKTMAVTYQNSGSAQVYGAQAYIFTTDPFTTTDDTSYLGNIAPGETKNAYFDINVNSDAPVKDYAIDSEIRYRDALNNDQVSDHIQVPVQVVRLSGLQLIVGTPYGILMIVIVIIAIGYLVYTKRKKKGSGNTGNP